MTRRTHLKYIISHTHSHTHTHTHTPCPLSTESAHWKRPDLCKALVSSTFSRFTCRSSLVHQCVIPLIVVLPMLRLRWALLNSPSCLIHILHIVIVYPLVALGVPWNHEQSFFFGGTFFYIYIYICIYIYIACCNALQCVAVSCITRPNTEGCLGTFSNTLFVPEVTITR